ncbi:MAG: four helix bundle protein [Candidatus Zambryskibacteria bacterium]|nr:four helix bundle protein [Candidatus Zambryskibacteria bacterium]
MPINSYKDLLVWQKGIELSKQVYILTEGFPKEEVYGLTSQMRRAAVSISSNIAEGKSRGTRKDFVQFLRISNGSVAELQTQIEIAKQLPKTCIFSYREMENALSEITKMLSAMIRKLSLPKPTAES